MFNVFFVKHTFSDVVRAVYSVRAFEKDDVTMTEFLIYVQGYGWIWDTAENYKPILQ